MKIGIFSYPSPKHFQIICTKLIRESSDWGESQISESQNDVWWANTETSIALLNGHTAKKAKGIEKEWEWKRVRKRGADNEQ